MISLGIIGTGSIAPHYIQAIHWLNQHRETEIKVVAAVNRTEASNERARNVLGIPKTYTSIHDMISAEKLDGIIVAVPFPSIYEVTMNLIPTRIPLLIEKPPGLTMEQTRQLSQLARMHQASVMVGFNRRFYSVVDQAKRLIEESGGLLGMRMDVFERYRLLRENGYPSEKLEKLFTANSIHCIDLIRYYCGELDAIHAFSNQSSEEPFNHRYAALIVAKRNIPITFQAYWHSMGNWNYELYLRDGKIQFTNMEEALVSFRNKEPYRLTPNQADRDTKPGFAEQMMHFLNQVILFSGNAGYEGEMSIHDAVNTMALVESLQT
ncbi:hypothetical protein ABH14_00540 [Brevibacillus brevis]|uniref:Gfo/Idh/MocA family protein n=1 Tax=Brevibacillus brevis TaxID=1393 RepID=UPI0019000D04|nr:Gfo/Idh/MocA family oxidoreductase [Brevibacillus brevis]MBH0328299.1 hypothetical protein [Brevibacillus brevis]